MRNRLSKKIGRILVSVTAVAVIFTTTVVTAFAAVPDSVTVVTSSGGDGSLVVILPQTQSRELGEAVLATLSASDRAKVESGTPLNITLSAHVLDKAPTDAITAAAPLLGDKQPELVLQLSLSRQLEGGNSIAVTSLDRNVAVTVTLPASLVSGEDYSIVTARDGRAAVTADTDNVPNTITFMVGGVPTVLVVKGKLTAPTVPVPAPVAPTTPVAKPANPTAGGINDDYLPRSILAQAVPISMPIPVAVVPTATFCESMAGTSMLMTAALVGGTIDYENSEHDEDEQEDDKAQEADAKAKYDEDAEDVEDYVESFDNTDYSDDLDDEAATADNTNDQEKYI